MSWQLRAFSVAVRWIIRRRRWGDDEQGLARRARFVFGATTLHRALSSRGIRIDQVREPGVLGEWLTPTAAAPGTILYLHGGGYVSCSPATHRPITAALARLSERRVFSLDYRLAPEHRFPAAVDDAIAAYRWLLSQGIRADSIAVAGDSAGGGLAFALLVRARDTGLPLPICVVGLSVWTDLAGTGPSLRANDGRCAMFRPENIGAFASAYLGPASPSEPSASPLMADLHGLPPVLLQVGTTELLLDDSRRLHERLLSAGVDCRLELYDEVFHVWQMLAGIVPEADSALESIVRFIRHHMDAEAPASPVLRS